MPSINLSILNQKATPAFFADTLANRPAPSFVGRVFISTDTYDLYRDTGTAWVLLSPSSTGTIGGSGTTDTIPLFSSSSSITNSVITQQTGAQSITIGSFATPFNVIGYANYYGSRFIINGGLASQILAADGTTITAGSGITISGGQISASGGGGGVTGSGSTGQVSYWSGASSITGNNNLFFDSAQGHLGINTNTPGTSLDIHHNQSTLIQLNQTTFGNDNRIAFQNSGIANWRIGNFYNFGSQDFAIQDATLSINRLTIKSSSGQTFIGDAVTSSGLFVVNNSSSDAHLVVLGASAPSVRVRNAGVGASQQMGIGLSTSSNNFIQGSVGGEMCIFNDSLTSSPILFGINQFGFTYEVARISEKGIQSKNLILSSNLSYDKVGYTMVPNLDTSILDFQTTFPNINFNAYSITIRLQLLSTNGGIPTSSVINCVRDNTTNWIYNIIDCLSSSIPVYPTLTFSGTSSNPTLQISGYLYNSCVIEIILK
jgi:hypothetical protein